MMRKLPFRVALFIFVIGSIAFGVRLSGEVGEDKLSPAWILADNKITAFDRLVAPALLDGEQRDKEELSDPILPNTAIQISLPERFHHEDENAKVTDTFELADFQMTFHAKRGIELWSSDFELFVDSVGGGHEIEEKVLCQEESEGVLTALIEVQVLTKIGDGQAIKTHSDIFYLDVTAVIGPPSDKPQDGIKYEYHTFNSCRVLVRAGLGSAILAED